MELQFSDAIEVANNQRKRRSASPRRRRSSKADTTPDDKFYITGEMFVYLMDQFEPKLTGFAEWAEQNYEPGSISYDSKETKKLENPISQVFQFPDFLNFLKNFGKFDLELLLTRIYRLPLCHEPACNAR